MEFVTISYLMLDIPAEHTLEEFGSELMRRTQDVLTKYDSCFEEDNRILEEPKVKYATPYNNMVMTHMDCWNEIVIDAIKSPSSISKRYALDEPTLMRQDIIFSEW